MVVLFFVVTTQPLPARSQSVTGVLNTGHGPATSGLSSYYLLTFWAMMVTWFSGY